MMRSILVSVATLLALCLPAMSSQAASEIRSTPLRQAHPLQVRAHLAALPLGFEPNQGQSARPVRFVAHGAGYTAFLTAHNITVALAPRGPAGTGAALH